MAYIEEYHEWLHTISHELWWENKRNPSSCTEIHSLICDASIRYTTTFGDAVTIMKHTNNQDALWEEGPQCSDNYRDVVRRAAQSAVVTDVYDYIGSREKTWEQQWHEENHAGLTFDEYYDIIVGYGIPNSNNETPESVIETLRGDGYVKSEEDYNNAYEAARDLKDDGAY